MVVVQHTRHGSHLQWIWSRCCRRSWGQFWQRGEAISVATQRLHALAPDPTASRAPRDAMLLQFEGLDRWIDRPAREHLTSAVAAHAINIERFDLPDTTVTDPVAAEYLLDRWSRGVVNDLATGRQKVDHRLRDGLGSGLDGMMSACGSSRPVGKNAAMSRNRA